MHIAIDARIISSGTGRYIERLLTHLEKLDSPHKFSVLVRKKDKEYWKPTTKNFKVIIADFENYSLDEQLGFNTFLKKLNPDLVHFCMPQQPLLYKGLSVTSILDLNLLRIDSNDMNSIELKIKKYIFAGLLKKVAQRSKHVITISNYSKKDILHFVHINTNKITVAYPAAEQFSEYPETIKQFKNRDYIMYVGRAESYKNNRTLIKAHQELLVQHPDLRLVIVGSKDKLRLSDMEWVRDKDYTNVDFVGFMSDAQLAWLYQNCKAYIFPSLMEGFGLPPLEAMQYGAPVASSNTTCLPEVLGDAALYFDPTDTDDMVDKISRILDDKDLRNELRKKGQEQVKKYSWDRMAKQTLEVYNEALKDAKN